MTLVLACGALVSELRAVLRADGLDERVEVHFLPARLHNQPDQIVPELRRLLDDLDPHADRQVLIGYADCGTGGALDRLIDERPNLRRLPGAHCYEFFAGAELFAALHDTEPGTFYLTDFLAKHFDALVWGGLGLDRHPQLRDTYFAHYHRVVLLSQTDDPAVVAAASEAATRLGLHFEHRHVGLTPFRAAIGKVA
ncbi:MAG: DUF1638 domain-containing protein [Ilumatobacteraceae bacterium]